MGLKPRTSTASSQREIFAAALRCVDVQERERLLDTECGADCELRAAIEELLRESAKIGDFLERPVVVDPRVEPGVAESPSGRVGEAAGDQIGPYTLIAQIGEGGSGSVYLAEQSLPVHRRVALKILKLGMDTKSVIDRFEAERQTLAMMEHPNIARVIDAGATEEGRPYFVMEYVPGEPLTAYCDQNCLTVDERLAVFIKICRGVEHAHQKGIIHRDLKPTNILVSEQDGEAIPKIIDFGVAKAIDPLTGETSVLTIVETVIGTPAYMSPEQAERGNRDIDTRSDVYSLGVILYELLTSYTPLSSAGEAKRSVHEALQAVRELEPFRPSVAISRAPPERRGKLVSCRSTTMERLGASCRGDLDWTVLKCLERERSRRFGSASELGRDLELFLAGAPVTARPPSVTYRLRKLVRRHVGLVVSCVLLLLTLIAAAVTSVAFGLRATDAEQEMREARDVQSVLREEAELDREKAVRSAEDARLHQYVAHINLAHHALLDGHIAKALYLLEKYASPQSDETDLRGFEWWYLMEQCLGDEHRSLPFQEAPVEALAFSPSAEVLAVATRQVTQLWSVEGLRLLHEFAEGGWSVAFLSKGELLAIAGREGVAVYDTKSHGLVWELREREGTIAVSRDGRSLATSTWSGVSVWDTMTWNQKRHLLGARGAVSFSPDGTRLVTGGREGMAIWELAEESEPVLLEGSPRSGHRRLPGEPSPLFTPDGRFVVVAQNRTPTQTGYVMSLWDANTGMEDSSFPIKAQQSLHSGVISASGFDEAGRILATSSWDHSVRLWSFAEGMLDRSLFGHRGEVWSVAVTPEGDLVASGSKDGAVKIWPVVSEDANDTILGAWRHLGFSSDGDALLALNGDGALTEFNLATGEPLRSVGTREESAPPWGRPAIATNQNFTVWAEGLVDGTVRINDRESGTKYSLGGGGRRVESLQLSPRGDTLIVKRFRDGLSWWDLNQTSEPIARIEASQAVFSADGAVMVTLAREGEMVVWDTATREVKLRLKGAGASFGSRIALSPDGETIARTHGFEDFENIISLWRVGSGGRVGTLSGHKQGIWSLAFSHDGRTLASSGSGGIIRLWNVAARSELLTIREHGSVVTDLAFSPNGRYLISGTPGFSITRKLRIFRTGFARE